MSDHYQPVYDAIRSRVSNGDIGEAVQSVFREANIGHYANLAYETVREVAYQYERPSVVFRPALSRDGNAWCALLGDDLQSGVAAFGDSPEQAMRAFDIAWSQSATPPTVTAQEQQGGRG